VVDEFLLIGLAAAPCSTMLKKVLIVQEAFLHGGDMSAVGVVEWGGVHLPLVRL
jgi:hypothetical protein